MKKKNPSLLTLLSQLSRNTMIALLAVAAIAVVAFLFWATRSTHATVATQEHATLSPTQVESLRAIGQWEFLTITDEELADTIRHGFFSDDELVRIYSGTLRLGIDMADTTDGWIRLDGDTLRVLLPPVRLLDDHFLDEANARSFYETGTWSQADRQVLAQQARRKMLARCLTPQNIASAEQNAAAQFHHLLASMGFPIVVVRFRE